jgi:hypothetical protein
MADLGRLRAITILHWLWFDRFSAYHYLLDELEVLLLKELGRMLEGKESDAASVEQAATILKISDSVMETVSRNAAIPQEASGPA